MAIKKYKPITPSLRHMTVLKPDEITKHEPGEISSCYS